MSCLIERNSENKVTGVYLESKESNNQLDTIVGSLLTRLQSTGLANKVEILSNQNIIDTFGETFKGAKGFVKDNIIYLNRDKMSLDTPIHEFSHLWINWVRNRDYAKYKQGINLIKEEGQVYIDKVKKTQPNLTGDFLLEEALAEAIGDNGAEIVVKNKSVTSNILDWLSKFWKETISNFLGLTERDNIESLNLKDFTESIATDLLEGVSKNKFTSPYTIQVLQNDMLQNKKGKLVSVQTIKQILNQQTTKKIEKDIINEVLDLDGFKGKGKIPFNEFEYEVNLRLLPLTVIKSDSFSSYGMANTGVSTTNHSTKIYNTSLHHGVVGHFSGDFPSPLKAVTDIEITSSYKITKVEEDEYEIVKESAEGSDKIGIGTIERKFGTNILEAVNKAEVGESVSFDTYRFENTDTTPVVAAFSEEEAISLLDSILADRVGNRLERYEIRPLQGNYAVVRAGVNLTQENLAENVLTVTSSREKAKEYIDNLVESKSINKGLFGHTRVWEETDENSGENHIYVAEIQSDSYQKEKAEILLLDSYLKNEKTANKSQKSVIDKIEKNQNIIYSTSQNVKDFYDEVQALYKRKAEQTFKVNEAKKKLEAFKSLRSIPEIVEEKTALSESFNKITGGERITKAQALQDSVNGKTLLEINDKVMKLEEELKEVKAKILEERKLKEDIDTYQKNIDGYNREIKKSEIVYADREATEKDLVTYPTGDKALYGATFSETANGTIILRFLDRYFSTQRSFSGKEATFHDNMEQALLAYNDELENEYSISKESYVNYFNAVRNAPKLNEELMEKASSKDKQFLAHRKNYTERLLREEIRDNAIKGAKTLSIPTPRTLALIEGYIEDEGNAPYEMEDEDTETLEVGDTIDYGGESYTVIESYSDEIEVIRTSDIIEVDEDDFLEEERDRYVEDEFYAIEGELQEYYTEEEWDEAKEDLYQLRDTSIEDIAEEVEDGVYSVNENMVKDVLRSYAEDIYTDAISSLQDMGYENVTERNGTIYYTMEGVYSEHFKQPSEYSSSSISDFDIDEMNSTEQTILKKYEKLIEFFKKERPDVETVTDDKGNEWLRTSLTEEDGQSGVVLFQKELERSETFDELNDNPLIDQEKALGAYKNLLTPSMQSKLGEYNNPTIKNSKGEPIIFYKVNGNLYKEYYPALKNAGGQVIEVGVVLTDDIEETTNQDLFNVSKSDLVHNGTSFKLNNTSAFTTLLSIDSNINESTYEGALNNLISSGLLSDKVAYENGRQVFKGRGEVTSFSEYNAQLVRQFMVRTHGLNSVKLLEDGKLELNKIDQSKIEVISSNGSTVVDRQQLDKELKTGTFEKLSKKYEGLVSLIYNMFRSSNDVYSEIKEEDATEESKADLRLTMLNLLNNLGVSVTSLSEYVDKHKLKNGLDPSVEALADIAKGIVAFAEGKDTVENITEETSHFIVEAFKDQSLLEEVLPLVEETAMWVEFSEHYRELYQDSFQGEELTNVIRREILGKLLKENLLNKFSSNEQYTPLLKRLWDSFLTTIKSFFTQNVKSDLNQVLDSITSSVIDGKIYEYMDASNVKNSKFVLYSVNNKKDVLTLSKAKQKLEKRLLELKKSKDILAPKVQQDLNRLNEAINKNEEWTAIKVLISSLEPQIRTVKSKLDYYKKLNENGKTKGKAYFNPAEQNAFTSLSEDFLPLLGEFKALIQSELKEIEGVNKEVTLSQIDKLINDITLLKGEKDLQIDKDNTFIANRILEQYNLGEEQRDKIEALIERDLQETSWFQRNFGSLEHSSNPFLGMLGKIINENNFKANTRTLKDTKGFLQRIDEEGWSLDKIRKNLLESSDGKISNYTLSPYKWSKFKKEEQAAILKAYNETTGLNLTQEQYKSGLKNKSILKRSDFDSNQTIKFNKLMNDWYNENTERKYVAEFYEKRDAMYKDLDISQDTIEFLQNISVRRSSITSKYLDGNNEIDRANFTETDLQDLDYLTQERKSAKSIIDPETGLKKTGSMLRLAEDLKKLDEKYQENVNTFKVKDSFFTTLEEVERTQGSEKAFKWLRLNGGIVFNDNFWGTFSKEKESLMEKIDRVKEELISESPEAFEILSESQDRLSELLERKTEILKQYQVSNNPSEINTDIMSGQVLLNIKEIESELQGIFKSINSIMKDQDSEEVSDPTLTTENTVNESYINTLKDSGMNELDFILEHVTRNDVENINEVKRRLSKIKEGSDFLDRRTKNFIEKTYGIEDADSQEVNNIISRYGVEALAIEYGKTRVLPYFKRFAPKGYESFLNDLKTGNKSVYNFVKEASNRDEGNGRLKGDVSDYLSVNTQFTWTEDEAGTTSINPNYDENFEGGYRQPKLEKFANDEFFDKFGINKSEFIQTKQLNPTTSLESFSMLEQLWDLKRKGLEAYNETGSQSIYKIPQISQGVMERTKDFVSKSPASTVGNAIKDIIYNRVDDLDYGQQIEGEDVSTISDMRLIPKYYLQDLEDADDVSTELAYSYVQFLHAANTYRERLNTVSDAMVLQETLLSKQEQLGLDENNSGYKMFKNFIDSYFFGIKRTRRVKVPMPNGKELDVSKIAIWFDKAVRYVNIGFSVPIAATSAVTGVLFQRLENYIGEHVNQNSASWANKEFLKLTPNYISEIGAINKESRMNQLAERLRVFDLVDRTVSSGFSKIVRASNNLPYKFSEIANYPIAPRIMLTVLDDFRLVGDTFIDFNTFSKRSSSKGLTKKELTAKWNTFRDNSMYNLLQEGDGIIDFPQELKDRIGTEKLEEQLSRAQARIMSVNSNVDSVVPQEDKSAATRDFLMNFMTAHRGWLSIAIQRKFKKQHFNFKTGQIEEGHYRTLGKHIKDSFSLMEEKNFRNFVKAFKENYNKLDDFEQKNLKRTMTELGVYAFLLGFGMLVAAMADDDDNKDLWALQYASYIYFRTVSEVGSVQAPTGVFGIVDTVQAPFIAINSVKEIMDVKGWSFDEVNSGVYEGRSKLFRKVAKQTWIRHWYDLKNPKGKSDAYRGFNAETLLYLGK